MDSWLTSPKDVIIVVTIILIIVLFIILIIASVYNWSNNSGNSGGGSTTSRIDPERSITDRYGPPLVEDSFARTPSMASSVDDDSDCDKVDPLKVSSDFTEAQSSSSSSLRLRNRRRHRK